MLTLLALSLQLASAQEGAPTAADPAPAEPAPVEAAPPAPEAPAAPVEAAPAPSGDVHQDALRLADRLIAEESWAEARSVLGWLTQPEVPEAVRAEAQAKLAKLPKTSDAPARLRLLPWQTVAGAWLLGPNMIWINESRGNFNERPLLVFTGALAGAAGGATASLLYKRSEGLSHAQATAIIHAEQLAMFHGAWLSLLHPEGEYWEYGGWGLLGGAVVGTAGGYALAELPLHEGGMALARTGALWGPGLTMLTLFAVDDEGDFWEGEPLHDMAPFVVAGDLATVGGYFIGDAFDLRRVDAQMMLLGGIAGTAVGGGLAVATQEWVLWSGRGVATTMEIFAIGGGALGYVLAQGIERPLPPVLASSMLSGTDEAPRLGLPIPSVARGKDGWAAHVQLVDLRF